MLFGGSAPRVWRKKFLHFRHWKAKCVKNDNMLRLNTFACNLKMYLYAISYFINDIHPNNKDELEFLPKFTIHFIHLKVLQRTIVPWNDLAGWLLGLVETGRSLLGNYNLECSHSFFFHILHNSILAHLTPHGYIALFSYGYSPYGLHLHILTMPH